MTDTSGGATCDRPELGGLVARYEFGAVSEAERRAFELHVLECDACFETLEHGAAAVETMREHAGAFRRVLEEERRAREERPAPAARAGRRPFLAWALRPRLLAPALGVLLVGLATTTWVSRRADVARLATFPRDTMRTTTVRAPAMQDAVRELMEAGAGYFDVGRYDEAARRFRAALERDPDLAPAAFALGLSLALSGDARAAVAPLESATRQATGDLRDEARWVLANAYLKSGNAAAARRELVSLAAEPGEYAARARTLAARLAP